MERDDEHPGTYLDVEVHPAQAATIEEMRKLLSEKFGVTVVGQFVTVRWNEGKGRSKKLKQVTMVVIDADRGY